MVCRITDDIINALQHCRLKAYFQLHGEAGAPCGYEKLLIEQRANVQRKAIEKIRREHSETELATDLNLTAANLRKGASFILGARLDDDRYAVLFDGLRKTDGPSMLEDFRYEPVIFCAARRVRASDRQELAAHAVLLARVQGALPGAGVVYLGPDGARTGIRFGPTLTVAENLLRDAERLQRAEARRTVTLKLKFNDFEIITRSRSVPVAVASRCDLERLSIALLQNEMPVPKPVRSWGFLFLHCKATNKRNRNLISRFDTK